MKANCSFCGCAVDLGEVEPAMPGDIVLCREKKCIRAYEDRQRTKKEKNVTEAELHYAPTSILDQLLA